MKIAVRIEEVFTVLDAKRVTLEEKMIRYYFYSLSTICSEMVTRFDEEIQGKDLRKNHAILLREARKLAEEILGSIGDFLKAAHYDLNYLEQYYEHKFLELLENDLLFIERARKINDELASGSDG